LKDDDKKEPSLQKLKETLLKREENGLEVTLIKGEDFEQIRVSTN
jgi:hypothetical protein